MSYLISFRRRQLLETENRLAFFHQIEPIARHGLEIRRVRFQEIYFARLPGEQHFLFGHLSLKPVDFGPALRQFFRLGQEETDDDEAEREHEKDAQNTVQTLPNRGFAPRAEIAVAWMIH